VIYSIARIHMPSCDLTRGMSRDAALVGYELYDFASKNLASLPHADLRHGQGHTTCIVVTQQLS